MILKIYIIILIYFLLGGLVVHLINVKRQPESTRKNWIKFITYFIIIHVLYFSIVINTAIFHFLAVLISITSLWELVKLFRDSGFRKKKFFWLFLSLYLVFAFGFVLFSMKDKAIILFTFLVLSFFDAFSQLSGQLFGKLKIFPKISPGKTWEGLIGGAVIAILSSLLLKKLVDLPLDRMLFLSAGIVLSGLIGDLSASFYKRQYGVKDFSNLLPGHGGFLDRFDSLIAGGAFITLFELLTT